MLDARSVRAHKSALTRAKKIGPEKVILVCAAALQDFEDNGYPDDWHRWDIALRDTEMAILRNRR